MDQKEYPKEVPDYNNNSRGIFTGQGIQVKTKALTHLVAAKVQDEVQGMISWASFSQSFVTIWE